MVRRKPYVERTFSGWGRVEKKSLICLFIIMDWCLATIKEPRPGSIQFNNNNNSNSKEKPRPRTPLPLCKKRRRRRHVSQDCRHQRKGKKKKKSLELQVTAGSLFLSRFFFSVVSPASRGGALPYVTPCAPKKTKKRFLHDLVIYLFILKHLKSSSKLLPDNSYSHF